MHQLMVAPNVAPCMHIQYMYIVAIYVTRLSLTNTILYEYRFRSTTFMVEHSSMKKLCSLQIWHYVVYSSHIPTGILKDLDNAIKQCK